MSSENLTEYFLTWVVTYGSPVLALALLLGALGVPLPGTFMVLAAGAFVRQGVIDWYSAFTLALLGVVFGDMVSYGMGRFANGWVERRFGESPTWQNAQNTFEQRGAMAIYLTRFLLTPLAIPTNLIAGGSGYPFWRFLLVDAAGETTWLLLYGGIGYTFASQWEAISDLISDFSGLLVGLAFLLGGTYLLLRRRRAHQAIPSPV
ncbi:MAG: DedA family protein [Ardenticatenaceae bacterium]